MKKLVSLLCFWLPFSAAFAQTNTWIPAATMSVGRADHAASLLPDGRVLITGGYNPSAVKLSSTEIYNPATNSWSASQSMLETRAAHGSSLLPNGNVLVIGTGFTPSNSTEMYSPTSNTWTPAASMQTPRCRATATLLPNGKVLVTGGSIADGTIFENVTNSCELYDPATNTWSPVAPMGSQRTSHAAVLLPNGKVLVAGGGQTGGGYLKTSEIYDPLANTWTPAAPMNTARITPKLSSLTNGKVLIVGGSDENTTLTSCEAYNPTTNTWSDAVSLPSPRSIHTATLLLSGHVFVTGGTPNGSASSILPTTLLFDITPTLTSVEVMPSSASCGQPMTLTATTSYALGPYSYTITDGNTPVLSGTATGTAFSQNFIPTGSGPKTYTLTMETDYARVSAAAPTVQLTQPAFTAVAGPITASGPASCNSPARLTAPATGQSFIFTGPGGYVFSNIYRNGGSYTAFAEGVKLGGTYTLTVSSGAGCPTTTSTVVVQGPGSCL